MAAGPLADVTVLDLTHYIAGPYCTKLLALYGAEVIKIERPGRGDPARHLGPFPGGVPHPEKSGLFLHLNTNKQSVTVNLKHPRGQELIRALVPHVDVVVENFSPRVLPSLGLSYPELEPLNPRLVMTSISNFGQSGPYRDWKAQDIVIYAMGGAMNLTGLPEREPLRLALNLMAYQGGNVAAAATMTGVLGARRLGVGQHIDVALMEVHAGSIDRRTTALLGYQYTGEPGYREEPTGIGIYPSGVYPCKDGYVQVLVFPQAWERLLAAMEMPELASDPRFADPLARMQPENRPAFLALFLDWLRRHTRYEAMYKAQAQGVPMTAVNPPSAVLEDPHFQARGTFVRLAHPAAGTLPYLREPFRMTASPAVPLQRAPLLGEHTEAVLQRYLGLSAKEVAQLRREGVV
ncbi:MAG: CoA transferase [Candidatus Tectimicrobiota bacterium]|nr:MAG: CoA transferase [Candidatus Tectomicrobia bacterium]